MRAVELLVVEDNAGDVGLIRDALYYCSVPVRVHVAHDGEQALLMLSDPHPHVDLIILDLNIPKIPGTVLLRLWQAVQIPVIVFTSSQDPTERDRCLSLGANDFVSKPMDLQDFSEAVWKIVENWTAREGHAVNC